MHNEYLFFSADNKNNCTSSSSLACNDGTKVCNVGQFKCHVSEKCIPKEWLCDGDFDCAPTGDTSDEDQQQCEKVKNCLPNQSECKDNVCIDTEKFCDGHFDCINDEYPEFCSKY